LALSVIFLFVVTQISREPLNGFAPKFTGKMCLIPR